MARDRPPPDPHAVASIFDLGRPTEPLARVPGGYSHRTWRLSTNRGRYAVKELNRDFDDAGYVARYEEACRVELTVLEAGIAIPRPVLDPHTDRACAELPDSGTRPTTVRAHQWVRGETLASGPTLVPIAGAIGSLLARIHALALPTEATPADVLTLHGAEHWRALHRRTADAGIPWSARFGEQLPVIAELETRVEAARVRPAPLVVTHRDLYQGNVILPPDGQVVLVDWDSSGPWVPAHELASVIVQWSGAYAGRLDEQVARALVRGYVEAGGELPEPEPDMFAGSIVETLEWLDVCVRRSLGERVQDSDHQRRAEAEAGRLLDTLAEYPSSLERWMSWVGWSAGHRGA
jgi:aminoglycoside phosphotransferase (APT) family kinase protein